MVEHISDSTGTVPPQLLADTGSIGNTEERNTNIITNRERYVPVFLHSLRFGMLYACFICIKILYFFVG